MSEEACVYRKGETYTAVIGEEVLPVTRMLDADGDEVDVYEDAVIVIAGPDKDQMWVTIELAGPAERMN